MVRRDQGISRIPFIFTATVVAIFGLIAPVTVNASVPEARRPVAAESEIPTFTTLTVTPTVRAFAGYSRAIARVAVATRQAPSGIMLFALDGGGFARVRVGPSGGAAIGVPTGAPVGRRVISATFLPDAGTDYLTSRAAKAIDVVKVNPSWSLAASTELFGSTATMTATLRGATAVRGIITLTKGTLVLGRLSVTPSGTVTFRFLVDWLPVPTALRATYGGSATVRPSAKEVKANALRTSGAGFTSTVSPITPALARRMTGPSWHTWCPVPLRSLSYLTLTYRGFDGFDHTGEMVVATAVAPQVVSVFRRMYSGKFLIKSMRLVDDFGGSDDASVAADNTSAFNCRLVTGGTSLSQHSYGRAIDINPIENPYVLNGKVASAAEAAFLGRPHRPGVIHQGDLTVSAFASVGWLWGGNWTNPIDYQHFSANGR